MSVPVCGRATTDEDLGCGRVVNPSPCFHDGAVKFVSSKSELGLQLADLVVHTLYRANKAQDSDPARPTPTLSDADGVAAGHRDRLAAAALWIPLPH